MELTIDRASEEMEDTLRYVAPEDSGELRRNIDWHRVNRFESLFYADVPQAEWVIEGTPAHDIYPSQKDALWWEGAEHPVRHVRHPGTRPNNFPAEAVRIEEDRIEGYASEAAAQVRSRYG